MHKRQDRIERPLRIVSYFLYKKKKNMKISIEVDGRFFEPRSINGDLSLN